MYLRICAECLPVEQLIARVWISDLGWASEKGVGGLSPQGASPRVGQFLCREKACVGGSVLIFPQHRRCSLLWPTAGWPGWENVQNVGALIRWLARGHRCCLSVDADRSWAPRQDHACSSGLHLCDWSHPEDLKEPPVGDPPITHSLFSWAGGLLKSEQGWEWEGEMMGHWGTRHPHRTDTWGTGNGGCKEACEGSILCLFLGISNNSLPWVKQSHFQKILHLLLPVNPRKQDSLKMIWFYARHACLFCSNVCVSNTWMMEGFTQFSWRSLRNPSEMDTFLLASWVHGQAAHFNFNFKVSLGESCFQSLVPERFVWIYFKPDYSQGHWVRGPGAA